MTRPTPAGALVVAFLELLVAVPLVRFFVSGTLGYIGLIGVAVTGTCTVVQVAHHYRPKEPAP